MKRLFWRLTIVPRKCGANKSTRRTASESRRRQDRVPALFRRSGLVRLHAAATYDSHVLEIAFCVFTPPDDEAGRMAGSPSIRLVRTSPQAAGLSRSRTRRDLARVRESVAYAQRTRPPDTRLAGRSDGRQPRQRAVARRDDDGGHHASPIGRLLIAACAYFDPEPTGRDPIRCRSARRFTPTGFAQRHTRHCEPGLSRRTQLSFKPAAMPT